MNTILSNKNINIGNIINHNLSKYNNPKEKYYLYKISNLMFHKKSHFTCIFIEYLIWDDIQEFLFELYSYKYSQRNIPIFIKFQFHYSNSFFPILRIESGRAIIYRNIKRKRKLLTYLSEKTKNLTGNNKIFLKKYSNILPYDLSDNNAIIKENKKDYINESEITIDKIKANNDINETESTIDNINANNDISATLDLKINNNYDYQILNRNIDFVEGINGKNDMELLNMLMYKKPLNTEYIYQNKRTNIKNKFIYLEYINSKLKFKSKYNKEKEKEEETKFKMEKKKKNKINSLNHNNKNNNISRNNKKESFLFKNNNQDSKRNNIILINKYNDFNDKTFSTKTNSYNKSCKNKSRNGSKKNINNEENNKLSDQITQIVLGQENRIMTSYESKDKSKETKENKNVLK